MTRDGDATLASSLQQLLALTDRAEQWQQLLEEPSAIEILGDLLLNEVNEGRIHQGAALGWLLGARQTVLTAEDSGLEALLWGEPTL